MAQPQTGLIVHDDLQAQARVSYQGKMKEVQMAASISPRPLYGRASASRTISRGPYPAPMYVAWQLHHTHCGQGNVLRPDQLTQGQRNLGVLFAAHTAGHHSLSTGRADGLGGALWSLQVPLLTHLPFTLGLGLAFHSLHGLGTSGPPCFPRTPPLSGLKVHLFPMVMAMEQFLGDSGQAELQFPSHPADGSQASKPAYLPATLRPS